MIEKLSFTTVLAAVIKTVKTERSCVVMIPCRRIFLIRIIQRKLSVRFRIRQKRCGKNGIKLSFMRSLMAQTAQ